MAALFVLIVAAPAALLVAPIWPTDGGLDVGDRAPRELVARRDAQFESQVLTERAREEAAAQVAPVLFPVDPAVRNRQVETLGDLLTEIRTIRQRTDLTSQQKLDQLQDTAAASLLSQPAQTALLSIASDRYTELRAAAEEGLRAIMAQPIQESTNVGALVEDYLAAMPNRPADLQEETALRELLQGFVGVNTEVDEERTEQLRTDARANASPVIRTISEGQTLAAEGEVLTAEQIEDLKATGVIEAGVDLYKVGAGAAAALGLGLLLGVYVYQFQPVPPPGKRRLLLIAFAIAVTLATVRFLTPSLLPDTEQRFLLFMIPVAGAAMIAASFADLQFGAIVAVGVGLFVAFIAAATPEIPGAAFASPLEALEVGAAFTAGGLAGASTVYRAEKLSRYAVASFAVAFGTALVLGVFWMLTEPRDHEALAWLAAASAVNGIAASVITVGVFVVLSLAFGVTTRLQLMELAQSNSPLMQRLQDEAPGTYHHSMMVGALAERAAEQIGADSLITRAGAYYHDIGKLAQPHYYIENILDGQQSPHDTMPPVESAHRIIEHVTNGLEMARKHRLPEVIRDFIPQHHGTRLVTYFYRKAINAGESPEASEFSYSGPRPRTKEAAIVMLADSCEAVVRAGNDRGPEQISAVVDAIFAERLAEGQLDDCDVTMRELQVVATSFKSTLRAVYHQRIEYPAATTDEAAVTSAGTSPAPGA
jgi:cyclic-di-AMP phosphodiesterase PgpH